MAVAQFNSEEIKGNILKVPVLTNSVKVQQKIVDLINWNKNKKPEQYHFMSENNRQYN